ncbi:MAG: hypothetical protein M3448_01155 [Pseudomonadota bacterium]|nr:hypothetical protein [Sphingomonas sp.]MDQ3482011.1 hypothetical protein [Pseudomonadota bacterium]
MSFQGENILVGIVCLALVPLIVARMLRGVRTGRLPLYRTYLERDGDQAKFYSLLALHGISLLLIAFIAADLLLGLGFRN